MLVNLLTPIQLSTSIDEWKCHHVTGGMFSVRSIYCYLAGIIILPISLEPDFIHEGFGILVEEFCSVKNHCFLLATFTSPFAYNGKSCQTGSCGRGCRLTLCFVSNGVGKQESTFWKLCFCLGIMGKSI
jgi:hypothetical protein